MYYIIIDPDRGDFDMPLFASSEGREGMAMIFSSEVKARRYAVRAGYEESLAELSGFAAVDLVLRLRHEGVSRLLVDPGGEREGRVLRTAELIGNIAERLDEEIGVLPEVHDQRQEAMNRVQCPICKQGYEIAVNDTIPMCCGRAMIDAPADGHVLLG